MTGPRRAPRRRDDAVAILVGAIVATGIVFAAVVVYRLAFIPVQSENAEAAHAGELATDLDNLKQELDSALSQGASIPMAVPISSAQTGGPLFEAGGLPSIVSFIPGDRPSEFWARNLFIRLGNESEEVGVEEEWTPILFPATTLPAPGDPPIGRVNSLRINLTNGVGDSDDDGKSVTITVRDVTGAFAGRFIVSQIVDPPSRDVMVESRDAADLILYRVPVAYHLANEVVPYWVNVLNPSYRFNKVLAAAEAPLTLQLEDNDDWGAQFAINYSSPSADGGIGEGGILKRDVHESYAGGTLHFAGDNTHFVKQEYLFENGAVVLVQSDGETFRLPPLFRAAREGGNLTLTFSLPTLTGSPVSLVEEGTSSVHLVPTNFTFIKGIASNMSLEVDTAYPTLWVDHWRQELDGASLVEGVHYWANATATSAKLEVFGPDPSPTSDAFDIDLTFSQADLRVEVRG